MAPTYIDTINLSIRDWLNPHDFELPARASITLEARQDTDVIVHYRKVAKQPSLTSRRCTTLQAVLAMFRANASGPSPISDDSDGKPVLDVALAQSQVQNALYSLFDDASNLYGAFPSLESYGLTGFLDALWYTVPWGRMGGLSVATFRQLFRVLFEARRRARKPVGMADNRGELARAIDGFSDEVGADWDNAEVKSTDEMAGLARQMAGASL